MLKSLTPLALSLEKAAPRYTSYPTAVDWHPLDQISYVEQLQTLNEPLAIYVHIPFCERMCLYCGCSVVLNRKEENERRYVEALIKEIELLISHLPAKLPLFQLHFGGGTPTKLSIALFEKLMEKIESSFCLDYSKEMAIEIDPRTVAFDHGEKLRYLKEAGFNRVSFGIQDTNAKVQEAIKRHQSYEMSVETYLLARKIGFQSINIDLIYGLPFQSLKTFQETIEAVIKLGPERIALFSYAKVPWIKKHQRAIKEEHLPTTEEKFAIYQMARERLIQAGYIAIGMDHFAKEQDELAIGYKNRTLVRNFQGYSVPIARSLIGIGMSAIGSLENGYFQNAKELSTYYAALNQNKLPIERGIILNDEDQLRRWVIHTIMCQFKIDKKIFLEKFRIPFDDFFHEQRGSLKELEELGLVSNQSYFLQVTQQGELLVRNIALLFDAYHSHRSAPQNFSRSI